MSLMSSKLKFYYFVFDFKPNKDLFRCATKQPQSITLGNLRRRVTMNKTLSVIVGITVLFGLFSSAHAWDPWGDITHPDRIIRNIGREAGNAGKEIDRIRLEANAQAGAPILQNWLIESEKTARKGAQPIPSNIRSQLQGFYDNDILNRVRFKVGDAGVVNLANLSITYGDAAAVTLINTVVFNNEHDAYNNAVLWAHELKHVQQFRDWGVRDFAIRYLRSWNSVENEATTVENNFAQTRRYANRSSITYQPRQQYQQTYSTPNHFQSNGACQMGEVYMATPGGACCTTNYSRCRNLTTGQITCGMFGC